MSPTPHHRNTSDTITEDIRVVAEPFYLSEHSAPLSHRFVFGYRITIRNEGARTVQLLSRYWRIIDGEGVEKVVEGPGVVGEMPVLLPGEEHAYTSFCPLETSWGTMEGWYEFRASTGETFRVTIGRFYLAAEEDVVLQVGLA